MFESKGAKNNGGKLLVFENQEKRGAKPHLQGSALKSPTRQRASSLLHLFTHLLMSNPGLRHGE
jgi:hypothetical protein